jgi:hypothetical protein
VLDYNTGWLAPQYGASLLLVTICGPTTCSHRFPARNSRVRHCSSHHQPSLLLSTIYNTTCAQQDVHCAVQLVTGKLVRIRTLQKYKFGSRPRLSLQIIVKKSNPIQINLINECHVLNVAKFFCCAVHTIPVLFGNQNLCSLAEKQSSESENNLDYRIRIQVQIVRNTTLLKKVDTRPTKNYSF